MAPPALAAAANPKIFPRTAGGPAVQAPTSKRQGLCKNPTALSKFHRRGEHCSPVKALCCHKVPQVEQSPTPTICRERVRLNFSVISQFYRRGEHCSPALAAPANPKTFPRTAGGPAMQAPTSKRQGLCKNSIALLKFHRRGEHCSPAKALRYHKAPGWSRAPPLQYAARECV